MMIDFRNIVERGKECGTERLSVDDCEIIYKTASELGSGNILEIGSCNGTSSMVFANVVKKQGGKLFCIEARPRPLWFENLKELDLLRYANMITGLSPWAGIGEIKAPLNYLLVDGDHQTLSALSDYLFWEKFVRKGGRIVFHDIYGPPAPRIWKAIDLILAGHGKHLKEIARGKQARDRGVIVFEKV